MLTPFQLRRLAEGWSVVDFVQRGRLTIESETHDDGRKRLTLSRLGGGITHLDPEDVAALRELLHRTP